MVMSTLQEFTQFMRLMQSSAQVAANLWTKPTDSSHKPAGRG